MINDYPFLEMLQNICKDVLACGATKAHVAGGAVRDSLLGKEIADIDVFYKGELDHVKVLKKFTPVELLSEEIINAYGSGTEWLVKYAKLTQEGIQWPIQLIQVKDFPGHIKTFGAGISKCWVDLEGLHLSPSFLNNEYLGVIDFSVDNEYSDKIKFKYPDMEYTGVVGDGVPF